MLITIISIVCIVYGIHRANRIGQGNAPTTTYHQDIGEHVTYTATDQNGEFIEYVHPDIVAILLCCAIPIALIVGAIITSNKG